MGFGDRRRMKRLAEVIYSVAPDFGLDPRIDALPPVPGFPQEAVALDAWAGERDKFPGVRVLCWPAPAGWAAIQILHRADTLDVINIAPYEEIERQDHLAPRWAIGAVIWALDDLADTLQRAYGSKDLPAEAANTRYRIVERAMKLGVVHRS